MIIEINQTSYYSLKLSIGPGSNTKVELLALWGLLYFAKEKDIWLDMVLGDSKTIVEWAKGSYKLHTIQLSHWINRTKILIEHFQDTTFSHIYRELNTKADGLSKLAIGVSMNSIEWAKFDRLTLIEQGFMNISQLR